MDLKLQKVRRSGSEISLIGTWHGLQDLLRILLRKVCQRAFEEIHGRTSLAAEYSVGITCPSYDWLTMLQHHLIIQAISKPSTILS